MNHLHVKNSHGDTLALDSAGNTGPTLLFIHGWTCRRDYWQQQLSDLQTDHRALALDLSGHGQSVPSSRIEWTISAIADDIVDTLVQTELKDVILVGHSMGGAVALEAACRTDMVRAVILVDTFVLPYGDLSEEDAQNIEQPFRNDFSKAIGELVDNTTGTAMNDSIRRRLKREMGIADPSWALPLWHDLLRWTPDPSFSKLTVPIHAINGDLVPEIARKRCQDHITEWLLPGAGHFPQLEMPDTFNRKLRDVLSVL